MTTLKPVTLFQAWHWTCPTCSHKNVEIPPDTTLTPDMIDDACDQLGCDKDEMPPGEWVLMPGNVLCAQCIEAFEVANNAPPGDRPGDEWKEQ